MTNKRQLGVGSQKRLYEEVIPSGRTEWREESLWTARGGAFQAQRTAGAGVLRLWGEP